MSIFQLIGSILLFIISVILVIIVLSQQGKTSYLGGAISGGAAESFSGSGKSKSFDSALTRATRTLAIIFVLLTVAVNALALIKK